MKKEIWLAVSVILGLILLMAGCKATRSGYESASYKTLQSDGRFEVREYPALVLVEAASREGADKSFNRLFRFITGNNASNQKIAMTTPVLMRQEASGTAMAFVMPGRMKADSVPAPVDDLLKVCEFVPGNYSVCQFKGGRNEANESAALKQLRNWMGTRALSADSDPVYSYFDPPWTPSFARRNEVMLRIK